MPVTKEAKKTATKISQIVESQKIAEIRQTVRSLSGKKLVVFDIDNVLVWLGSDVLIGTDPWFEKHLKDKHEELGDLTAAENATLDIFIAVHTSVAAQAVDPETADFINELQQEQTCVVALTSRSGKYLAKLTREQANSLNVCFSRSHRFNSRTVDLTHLGPHCHVEEGYFYTGGKDKGVVLTAGLAALGIPLQEYDHVIFIDDDLKRLHQVQQAINGITNFMGFRYGVLDNHLRSVRERIATFMPYVKSSKAKL